MWAVTHDLGLRGFCADALFVSGLRRCDEPGAAQVRQAIAEAIRAFGRSGCAGRVAQEFGDHPETAVIRMRWACAVAGAAFAESANESSPHAEARRMLLVRPRLPADQASRASGDSRGDAVRRAWAFGLLAVSPRSG